MWTEEVVISDPECKIIVRSLKTVKAVCVTVGSLVCAVQSLNDLLIRTEFCRYCIVVLKSDYLGDLELHAFADFKEELLRSQGIGTVSISDETEPFGQYVIQFLKNQPHCHDTGADTSIVGYAVAENGSAGGIDDEPDVCLYAADLNICLICKKSRSRSVVIVIYKGFYAQRRCFAIVGDLLVGYLEAIQIHQCL